ncbi:calcium-binding protein [Rhizobium giardinii]|jgi:serralysin|uniref:Ca2+-binding RTX toxin-like protein n=1 Tax=Rhizobium giardinii TaxID=56731 RepID=A0A7W8UI21_9HYPH|nr:hypothetical protein [Rhizobium giardinii]MBB5539608.1 Ca2+-binding RTX toxin-like protein [Rhizobium giardinii]
MGVTLRMGADYSIDMSDFDFNASELPSAYISQYNSTTIVGYADGVKVTIKGAGFTYGSSGITGGEIQSISETWDGETLFSLTGLQLSVKSILSVVESGSISEAKKLLTSALSGADDMFGGQYSDTLYGFGGNDYLAGGRGDDALSGGSGVDRLQGGLGVDTLFGGTGNDTFVYTSATQSNARLGLDTIRDLTIGDKIDLSGIDASVSATGNQAFSFIGTATFHGKAGELRFEKKASDTYIYGDVNGDKVADFALHLDDAVTLSKGFFAL